MNSDTSKRRKELKEERVGGKCEMSEYMNYPGAIACVGVAWAIAWAFRAVCGK